LAAATADDSPQVRALTTDGSVWDEAGATTAQQLGTMLAAGVAFLRAGAEIGLEPSTIARQIEVRRRLGTEFFEGITAVRATRRLWARVMEICNLGELDALPPVHALASRRILSRRDPWVNLLRNTSTGFAGIVGGADVVTCLPFDGALEGQSELGRRLARNTLSLLTEESHLHAIVDPAGGSWFLEDLSEQLAERAWAFFRQIETEGGLVDALVSGWLRARVDESWREQHAALSRRQRAVTGVSEFPAPDRARPKGRPADVQKLRARLKKSAEPEPRAAIETWPLRTLASPFESLRDAAEAHGARTGKSPTVFLAKLGRVADHVARANWTQSLFAAGGFEVEEDTGVAGLSEAFGRSGAAIAILCSSDPVYETDGEDAARALREAGARSILLAGRPGPNEERWRAAGIDRFLHVGCDVRATLAQLLDEEGVER
jgi:methylmalonyl-CoA mutase